jgi:cell division protein FtsQ
MTGGAVRMAVVLAGATTLTAGAMHAPMLLERVDAFAVTAVEVAGARLLAAEDVVAIAGITPQSTIFDDPAPWRDALLRHPLVRSVDIERRVPGTVRIEIRESMPVALARTPELRPVDERGMVLPASTAADGMDLPVLMVETRVSAQGRAADRQTRQLAAFLGTVLRTEPGLIGWISEAGVHGNAVRLVLRTAGDADVLVPAEPSAERLRELHFTLADLAAPRYASVSDSGSGGGGVVRKLAPELSRVTRIDGRFHDQVVVAIHRQQN